MIATTEEQLLPVGQSFHDVPWKKPAKIIKEGFENPVGRLKSVYVLLGIKRGLEIKGPVIKQAAVQFNVGRGHTVVVDAVSVRPCKLRPQPLGKPKKPGTVFFR